MGKTKKEDNVMMIVYEPRMSIMMIIRDREGEEYTPYVDAKINANVVKPGSHEVVLYDHFQGLFHVKANRGSKKTSSSRRTYRVNLCGRPKSTRLHNEMDIREGTPNRSIGPQWRVSLSLSHNPSPHVLTFYQDQLDAQTRDQVLWEPYTTDLIAHLLAICQADEEIWRTMSPLICFDIIEWHRPEQVLRQFRDGHRVHLTHEPSTSLGPSMRPPSLITPIRTYSPPSPPSSQPSISLDAPPPIIKEQLMPHDYMYGYLEDIDLYMYVEFYLHQFHLTRQVM
ncbi:Serine/threonine-protein phosphatase 7 long form-like [Vitis vinifera]|uniref:Serine/threonine-protein phosphatase 7 long form-like n=1 Tax=Vitis vinifera TaxID=29760 RepID=A0A438GFZ6_VITVI|nr:Serine/threonine-protein phosphatase 7 long form-like [Vitis vinifera]